MRRGRSVRTGWLGAPRCSARRAGAHVGEPFDVILAILNDLILLGRRPPIAKGGAGFDMYIDNDFCCPWGPRRGVASPAAPD